MLAIVMAVQTSVNTRPTEYTSLRVMMGVLWCSVVYVACALCDVYIAIYL